jgi:hypothetical protein
MRFTAMMPAYSAGVLRVFLLLADKGVSFTNHTMPANRRSLPIARRHRLTMRGFKDDFQQKKFP